MKFVGIAIYSYVHTNYMRCFLDGHLTEDPMVSAFDEGLLYGYGVYETLRVYSGVPFRSGEHIRRLQKSAELVGLPVPSASSLSDAVAKTISANRLKEGALRVVLTAGSKSWWGQASPSLLVLAKSLPKQPPSFKAITVPFHRDVAKAKTLNCLTSILARQEASLKGADEALFTLEGNVLEGTTANIFAVKGNEIITPKEGVLDGITRGIVVEIAKGKGFHVKERRLPVDELYGSDEIFLTGSVKQVIPVREVDRRKVPLGKVVPLVSEGFDDYVRNEIQGKG